MIAIGGAIGTGLFVGSGKALAAGGPESLMIAFALISLMLYCTVYALGELSVMILLRGEFPRVRDAILGSGWGVCHGLELCVAVDGYASIGDCGCCYYDPVLGIACQSRGVGDDISGFDL
jgi:hypothetical protein